MTEKHYLTCMNENCEKFACVARRDYEQKVKRLENEIYHLKLELRADGAKEEYLKDKKEERKFPFAKARRWRNKISGKEFKVLPWFQPVGEESRFDFKGLIRDLFPEFTNDVLAEFNCYSGLVIHAGWQLHNDAGVWFCVQHGEVETHFDDLGDFKEEDGPVEKPFPLTEGDKGG